MQVALSKFEEDLCFLMEKHEMLCLDLYFVYPGLQLIAAHL